MYVIPRCRSVAGYCWKDSLWRGAILIVFFFDLQKFESGSGMSGMEVCG